MKKALILILLLTAATPLLAQSRTFDIIPRYTLLETEGDEIDSDDDAEDVFANFDSESGYGLGLNIFLTDRISLEVGASVIEPDVNFIISGPDGVNTTQGLEMIPITAALQFHFLPNSRFDPYIGAGGTYILFDDVDSFEDLEDNDVSRIELDDEVGVMYNAGFNLGLTDNFALNIDAKYSEIEPEFALTFDRDDFTADVETDFNPLLVSAGLSFRF